MLMKKLDTHRLLRILSIAALAIATLVLCLFARTLSAEDILRWTPDNPLLAALVITLMTAAASMIPVFPMMIFYFACGMLFPFFWAVLVSALGVLVEAMLQYALGRRMGAPYIDRLLGKYPKLAVIRTWQVDNDVFLTYLLRISGLPVNMVSLFVGAMGVSTGAYLLGTYIGMLPGLLSCILISVQVKGDFSWQLIATIVGLNAASFGVAFVCNRLAKKRAKKYGSDRA